MNTIEIDEQVFEYLQKNAIAYIEKPNDTLRRLFLLDEDEHFQSPVKSKYKRKKPRTSLRILKNKGIIKEGQILHIRDYHGDVIPNETATIAGEKLLYHSNIYSMSELAVSIFKRNSYRSDSVRGPQFWYTKDSKSIMQLWNDYLESNKSK